MRLGFSYTYEGKEDKFFISKTFFERWKIKDALLHQGALLEATLNQRLTLSSTTEGIVGSF
jgi:hypothetical protein